MSLLKIKNASTGYGNKQVLFDVSLNVEKGDTVLLIGSNGSGKSTLLKLVYGLMDVWKGTVEFDGQLLHSTSKKTPTHKLIDMGRRQRFGESAVLSAPPEQPDRVSAAD